MVRYLLERPVAVCMAFLACVVLGVVTWRTLPVSLLPDGDIPWITVQVNDAGTAARELENSVVAPVRRALLQVNGVEEVKSRTRDGSGWIRMKLRYGTDTDLAFIEVNERIDGVMGSLPKQVSRPQAVKASATDIPVFYLNVYLRDSRGGEGDDGKFLELCEMCDNMLRRRIEQLPGVALADVTGIPGRQLLVRPREGMTELGGFTWDDIENTLTANNVEAGDMRVRDGYYQYTVRVASLLHTQQDVENLFLTKNGHLTTLGDLCEVRLTAADEQGRALAQGHRAVTLAIVKQAGVNMGSLKKQLAETTGYFQSLYPELSFSITRNQTELLDYTIRNLEQNLGIGLLLIMVVCLLFMRDGRASLVIAISMAVAVAGTFLGFYLFGLSLNVISLSGLILAVGLMIDNFLIVTENIAQHRERGLSVTDACARGTNEMMVPLLSSSLTTVTVFVPLVFMSGIAGVLFFDEAFSITAGLAVSYLTAILLLPVLYRLLCGGKLPPHARTPWLAKAYDKGAARAFAHKGWVAAAALLTVPLAVVLFRTMPVQLMPDLERTEQMMRVDWNESVTLDENCRRVQDLLHCSEGLAQEHTAEVGMQDYLLHRDDELTASEAELYFRTANPAEVETLTHTLQQRLQAQWPGASVSFHAPETLFERLFVSGDAEVVAQFCVQGSGTAPTADEVRRLEQQLQEATGRATVPVPFERQLNLVMDRERMQLYGVSSAAVLKTLRTAFRDNQVTTLRSFSHYLPVTLTGEEQSLQQVLNTATVPSSGGEVPLRTLLHVVPSQDLKAITAGAGGEYLPFGWDEVDKPAALMHQVREVALQPANRARWQVDFAGDWLANRRVIRELAVVLAVALLLMYFILCAQFESFVQPLVVLAEIPIDTAFALLTLWACGHTLNVMSAIGIVVSCGIVVNDSILKLDTVNALRRHGMTLDEAIHTAGRRRVRPIVMTTLTTLLAMLPLLCTHDMGSQLQAPLAVAMMGALVPGTLVSLFVIPVLYYLIERKKK